MNGKHEQAWCISENGQIMSIYSEGYARSAAEHGLRNGTGDIYFFAELGGPASALEHSIVHFFSVVMGSPPICQLDSSSPVERAALENEWVCYDHTAVGKICLRCQSVLNRRIE